MRGQVLKTGNIRTAPDEYSIGVNIRLKGGKKQGEGLFLFTSCF
jgi:hypothetical protein